MNESLNMSNLFHASGKKTDEAAENRNYLASRMTDEINEIIRVLQLTTYDEDEWDADNLTCMKKAQVKTFFASKLTNRLDLASLY